MESEYRQSIQNVEGDLIEKNKFNYQYLENQVNELKDKLKVSNEHNDSVNEVIEKYKMELKSNQNTIMKQNYEISHLKDTHNVQTKK